MTHMHTAAHAHTPNQSSTNTYTGRRRKTESESKRLCAEPCSDVFLFLHFSFHIRAVVLEYLAGIYMCELGGCSIATEPSSHCSYAAASPRADPQLLRYVTAAPGVTATHVE